MRDDWDGPQNVRELIGQVQTGLRGKRGAISEPPRVARVSLVADFSANFKSSKKKSVQVHGDEDAVTQAGMGSTSASIMMPGLVDISKLGIDVPQNPGMGGLTALKGLPKLFDKQKYAGDLKALSARSEASDG